LAPGRDGKGDQENHDSDGTEDVRHHGNEPSNVARVGPQKADNYSHDEHSDHRSKPVENPSSGDDAEPTLTGAFRQSKRQSLLGAARLLQTSCKWLQMFYARCYAPA
jgi:hypothetical protein